MAIWDIILRTPPLLITAISLATFVPFPYSTPRVFTGDFGTLSVGPLTMGSVVSTTVFVVWSYSLYVAASMRSPPEKRSVLRLAAPIVAAAGVAALFPLADVLYYYPGDPPPALIAIASILLAVSVMALFGLFWMSSNALLRFEARGSKASRLERAWTFVAIATLGIGIWFVHGRIKHMLAQPIRSGAYP